MCGVPHTASSTIIYGSGADGNYDGVINAADYLVWRNSLGAPGAGATAGVPEPTALGTLGIAAALLVLWPPQSASASLANRILSCSISIRRCTEVGHSPQTVA